MKRSSFFCVEAAFFGWVVISRPIMVSAEIFRVSPVDLQAR